MEYYIRVVKPNKSIDYKILDVEVDPNIDAGQLMDFFLEDVPPLHGMRDTIHERVMKYVRDKTIQANVAYISYTIFIDRGSCTRL